jgi:predicted DNA-binding transcriptional regulator YafY
MARTERFSKIERLLRERRSVSFTDLQEELEVSRATLFRDMAFLRDRMRVPVIHDPESGHYRLDRSVESAELPGLWFSAQEAHALLSMRQLLANLEPGGLLGTQLDPLKERLTQLLGQGEHPAEDITHRIRVIAAAARRYPPAHFQSIAGALMERHRLQIHYQARSNGSLQPSAKFRRLRLTHYRDNWYLDAWCHLRDELRSFAVDAIKGLKAIYLAAACDSPDCELDSHARRRLRHLFRQLTVSAGRRCASPPNARAGSRPNTGTRSRKPSFLPMTAATNCCMPYSNDPELIMDILKYGPDCEVIAPMALREKVVRFLRDAVGRYGNE